jgi:hypothetical protein
VKPAALGFSLILLALPFASRADENLVAKREACRHEARVRVVPKGKIGVDEYRRVVERRNVHVSQCMTRVSVARMDPPLPPKKVLEDASSGYQISLIAPVRKKSQRIAKRPSRGTLKTASIRTSKGKSLGGKRPKRLNRKNK